MSTTAVTTTLPVGPYLLSLTSKEISSGGHSRIVSGFLNDAAGTPVAVKLQHRADPHVAAELKAMMQLSPSAHPHVVRAFPPSGFGDLVAMPLALYDGDLFNLVEKMGRLSEPTGASAMAQLVSAVSFMHSKGVYHLDLKPENVLYTQHASGAVTLAVTDFGACVLSPEAVVACPGVSTPAYSPPEQHVEGAPINAAAADVWSLGITLYAILTASLPWGQASFADEGFCQWAADGELPLDANLSEDVVGLLRGMLAVDPAQRLTLAEVAAHPWMARRGAPVASHSVKLASVPGRRPAVPPSLPGRARSRAGLLRAESFRPQ